MYVHMAVLKIILVQTVSTIKCKRKTKNLHAEAIYFNIYLRKSVTLFYTVAQLKKIYTGRQKNDVSDLYLQFGRKTYCYSHKNEKKTWVPCILNENNQNQCVRQQHQSFLDHIVTGEEKWCLYIYFKHINELLSTGKQIIFRAKCDLHPYKKILCAGNKSSICALIFDHQSNFFALSQTFLFL